LLELRAERDDARVNRSALADLLTIADALAQAPTSFLVRRTLQRIQSAELGAAEAAAVLRAHQPRWGATLQTTVCAKRRVEALSIGRLFDR
jgi:hypothetical protein